MKNALIKNGTKVEDAISFFKEIIMANGLEYHAVNEFEERVFLKYMADPMGWLSSWMLRSDELCALITGSRMWDAYYVRNSESMRLMTPINSDAMKDERTMATQSYESFPLADDIGVPLSVKYAIANSAFKETLILYPNQKVDIKLTTGFYDIKKELEDGEVLPFQSPTHLNALFLNRQIVEYNKENKLSMSLAKELEV
ncbi:hypothetical protein [Psychromonas sp. SP041]|uniref:hypothetical protein n=1 Tax=Psychromonas sp. SP041 TaxID=1365007 RepID=UPI0010C7D5BC|nr:hypothetical protein [Psychromonas sp. SP041]